LGFPARGGPFWKFRHRFPFRRIDCFSDSVSGGGTSETSHGGSRDCTDGTSHDRTKNRTGSRTAGGSHSCTQCMRTRISCRIDRLTGLVPGRSSSDAAHRGPRDCADGATQSRAKNRAASRSAGGSRSGTNRMRTRLSWQINFLVHHDEPPSVYDHRKTSRLLQSQKKPCRPRSKNAARFDRGQHVRPI
jgi:hypothetical protein